MNTLRFLLTKEFKQIFRHPVILRLIMIMPVIQLILIPLAADFEVKHLDLAVVDQDHSPYAQQLIQQLSASTYFDLVTTAPTYEQALVAVEKSEVDIVLTIPPDFESTLIRENEATLFLAADAVNPVKAGLGSAYALRIIQRFNQDVRLEWLQWPAFNPAPMIDIRSSLWYNPHINYVAFMAPGILGILVTMVGALLSALNIVAEKEAGTIEQLNVTPIKKWQFILGKLIPFWVLGLISITVGMFVAWVIFGLWPEGSFLAIYFLSMVYLLAVLGIGLLISTFADNQQQATLYAFFLIMCFILLSGLFTPVDSMPPWAQVVARLNPPTYFIQEIRAIYLKGSTLADLWQSLLIIFGLAVFFNTLAIWNYRKRVA
jgi:ABC-2 type transport system permease protein